jgi:anti-sigma B factor antagonist
MIMNHKIESKTYTLPRKFTYKDVKEFNKFMIKTIGEGVTHLILDASSVEFIDSAGLGILVKALKDFKNAKGKFQIEGLKGEPLNIFHISGADRLFLMNSASPQELLNKKVSEVIMELDLNLQVETVNGAVVLHFAGIMSFPEGWTKFKNQIQEIIPKAKKVILDLKHLKYLDSYSISELLHFSHEIKQQKGQIRFCNANELVKDIFKRIGLDTVIEFFETLQEALEKE